MKHCQCGTVFMPNLVIPTQEITSPNKVTCNVTKNMDNIHTYESFFNFTFDISHTCVKGINELSMTLHLFLF